MALGGLDLPDALRRPARLTRPRRGRGRALALVLGAAAIGAYYLLPRHGLGQALVVAVLAAGAVASTLRAGVRATGTARTCWLLLASGLALAAASNGAREFSWVLRDHPLPFPSWADTICLLSVPCFAAALATVALARRGADPVGDLLDALVVIVGGGGLLAAYALLPAARHGGGTPVAHLVALAYPAADLVLLTLVVPVLVSHRLSVPLLLVGGSLLALLTGDTMQTLALTHNGTTSNHVAHAFWLTTFVLLAAAPIGAQPADLSPDPLPAGHRMTNGRWGLLAGALLAGPLLLLHRGTAMLGIGVSSLVLALVVLRLAHLNRRLTRASEDAQSKNEQLRHHSMHDALTGLPNRALITERIEWMLSRGRRPGSTYAALLIDLDGFKHVNDSRGHEAGDALLQAVARRLTGALREVDSIGRVGGDEFAVLIDEVELSCAPELVAARIIDVLRQPFDLGPAGPVVLTATIGIAIGSREQPGDLLRDADLALNQAKAAGRNCYEVFAPEMETSVQRRYELELDLRQALGEGQFELVYQPIYDLDELTLVGLEALLRWNHPRRGQLPPADFVPVLESSGQIVDVGRWVLLEACRQMAAWRRTGVQMMVSVNVSPRQLDRDSLVEHVREALAVSGLEPSALTIEVTETALMRNVPETARRLRELKELGVQVAIDDFGTGYSSLAYLQQFPVDCLKIDQTFIDALSRSPESDALIHTLVQLGQDLGLRTLAEGVETAAQMARLRKENVDAVQGFLFARPMTVAAVEAELGRRTGGAKRGAEPRAGAPADQPARMPAGEA